MAALLIHCVPQSDITPAQLLDWCRNSFQRSQRNGKILTQSMWVTELRNQSLWQNGCHNYLNIVQTSITVLLTCAYLTEEETAASLYILLYNKLVAAPSDCQNLQTKERNRNRVKELTKEHSHFIQGVTKAEFKMDQKAALYWARWFNMLIFSPTHFNKMFPYSQIFSYTDINSL